MVRPPVLFGQDIRARQAARPETTAVLLAALAERPAAVALLGAAGAGPRGRYSVFGVPARISLLGAGGIRAAFDDRRRDSLRVVLLGYELGHTLLALPPRAPPRGQPAGLVLELPAAIVVDHHRQEILAVGDDSAAALLEPRAPLVPTRPGLRLEPLTSDAAHTTRLHRVLEHIAAGDIYQASLTRRLQVSGATDGPAAALLLTEHNPVAHGAWLRVPGFELVSNSMETLLAYAPESRCAESFPIKGTRPRSGDAAADLLQRDTLATSEKERAEHVMIVDLVRHDLGRVARPGGVSVPGLMQLEPYAGVWHGVSTVRATLEGTLGDAAAALFPGGSITGAPKRRATELLADIEQEPRGAYTGSLALVAPDGTTSMSILIRTLVKDDEGWSLNVGGGIVADSTAPREIEETWEKVAVFRKVLG